MLNILQGLHDLLPISNFKDYFSLSKQSQEEVERLYFELLDAQDIDYLEYEVIDSENHITETRVKEEFNLSPEEMLQYLIEMEETDNEFGNESFII